MPPKNATGTKTAASTKAIATTGPCTSSIARSVASTTLSPSSMWCSTFSMTTMASSTTRPMASTMAKSVSVLMLKSSAMNAMNVPIKDTGTARSGISVARQLCRNTKMTSTTRRSASTKVCTTSVMDSRI